MQKKPEYVTLEEWTKIASQLVEAYPAEWGDIDVSKIAAYAILNKDRPEGKAKAYEMTGETEPESFTNTKQYFVKLFKSDWDAQPDEKKVAYVVSALDRIDTENPGKVLPPFDYRDQNIMVHTYGPNWQNNPDIPNILREKVIIKRSENDL